VVSERRNDEAVRSFGDNQSTFEVTRCESEGGKMRKMRKVSVADIPPRGGGRPRQYEQLWKDADALGPGEALEVLCESEREAERVYRAARRWAQLDAELRIVRLRGLTVYLGKLIPCDEPWCKHYREPEEPE
jgi:hypothetical protein